VTFYKDVNQLPAFEDYSMANRTYRYMQQEPEYGFGYGLSYTKFEYSNLVVRPSKGDGLAVSADLVNRGTRESDEVVQVYLTPPRTAVGPKVELAAFRRVHLRAGERQRVAFDLPASRFEVVNEEGKRVKPEGTYGLWVGGGQPMSGLPGVSKASVKP
jgi:beta-glucosidase